MAFRIYGFMLYMQNTKSLFEIFKFPYSVTMESNYRKETIFKKPLHTYQDFPEAATSAQNHDTE